MPNVPYKNEQILLIASYRKKYDKKALKRIKKIILGQRPDKVIILKIIEEEKTSKVVEANVGIEEKNDFLNSVLEEKKTQVDKYAAELIQMTESMEIPTEVRLRKGEEISEQIINDYKEIGVNQVVIHGRKKGSISSMINGSTAERVKKCLPNESVFLVD